MEFGARILTYFSVICQLALTSAPSFSQTLDQPLCIEGLAKGFQALDKRSSETVTTHFYRLSQQVEAGNILTDQYLKSLGLEKIQSVQNCDEQLRIENAIQALDSRKVLMKYADFYASAHSADNLELAFQIENLPEKISCLVEQIYKKGFFTSTLEIGCGISPEEKSVLFSNRFVGDLLELLKNKCSFPFSDSDRQRVVEMQYQRIQDAKLYYDIAISERDYFHQSFPNLKGMYDEQLNQYGALKNHALTCIHPKQALFDKVEAATRFIQGSSRGIGRVASGTGFFVESGSAQLFVTAFHSVNLKDNTRDLKGRGITIHKLDPDKDLKRIYVDIFPNSHASQNDVFLLDMGSSDRPTLEVISSMQTPQPKQIFYVGGHPDVADNKFEVYECIYQGTVEKKPYHLESSGFVKKFKLYCPAAINLQGISGGALFDESGVVWGVDSAQDFIEGTIYVSPIHKDSSGSLRVGK